ncbi:trypsin-like peptidase domain-containing protein [Streptomyces sp. NPDC096152]|uniref:trypsin-like peptidase domain-containing protein n=1 Tax=Streptomyces sp. NPDC096152 TaxID=3366078 RepID=UPI00380EDA0A
MAFDATCVVEVWNDTGEGGGSYGSGYEIATGLVLTAGHILAERDAGGGPPSVEVRYMREGADWTAARVVWYDGDLDAALLAVAADPPPGGPVRFGELTGADPQHPVRCGVLGFPQVQATPRGRDSMGVAGTVDACTLRFSRRYQINLTPLQRRRDWSGMSGAAVFCGPLLTAVLRSVPDGFHASRVNAVPVCLLLRDEGFQDALRTAGGTVPELESVELEPLAEAPPCPAPRSLTAANDNAPSVSHLLHPRTRTVPFRGREAALERLTGWATSDCAVDVMMVTGPMGAGKTRLAVEIGRRLGHGWVTAFLRTEPPDASPAPALHPLTTSARHLLLVVDYAETRPAWRKLLLAELAGYRRRVRVRLLLLCRNGAVWREEVVGQCRNKGLLSDDGNVLALGELEPGGTEPEGRFLGEAARAFAERLYGGSPFYDLIAPTLDALPPTGDRDPFSLGLTACAAAISAFERSDEQRAIRPYQVVLDREARYWMRGAEVFGLPVTPETRRLVRSLVVTQALVGGRDVREAAAAVAAGRQAHYRHWGTDQADPERLSLLHHLLKSLYPSHDAEWGRLGPHALSAHLIGTAELQDRGLTRSVLTAPELNLHQRRRGLETLLLGASRRPHLADVARDSVADSPVGLGLAAALAAPAAEDPVAWLGGVRDAIRGAGTTLSPEERADRWEVADRLDDLLGDWPPPDEPEAPDAFVSPGDPDGPGGPGDPDDPLPPGGRPPGPRPGGTPGTAWQVDEFEDDAFDGLHTSAPPRTTHWTGPDPDPEPHLDPHPTRPREGPGFPDLGGL